jgi:hypothetical protein
MNQIPVIAETTHVRNSEGAPKTSDSQFKTNDQEGQAAL